ncbi:hypothetical protein Syun_021666 [Stephania yunnanensis]|uniref:Uncharacterized protein n=1 Tax=Stephania yunnanensis TaxID=152371 RepID=A0AAP0IG02_9MAGN
MVKMRRFNCPENFFLLEGKTLGSFHLLLEKVQVACVEGINKAEIGEGDNKVKANLAKPRQGSDWKEGLLKVVIRFGWMVKR